MILCEGSENNKNTNNNNPARGGTGGSAKVKSCKDDDGAQGCELSRPTTICCAKNCHAWNAHCLRGNAPSLASLHIGENRADALRNLRKEYILKNGTQGDSISVQSGRFGRRLLRGRPPMRWEEALERSQDRRRELLTMLRNTNGLAKNRKNKCTPLKTAAGGE